MMSKTNWNMHGHTRLIHCYIAMHYDLLTTWDIPLWTERTGVIDFEGCASTMETTKVCQWSCKG